MKFSRLSRTMGLVGTRAYEGQAWHSPGARALDMAVWEATGTANEQTPARVTLRTRLSETVRAVLGRRGQRP
jgi:hypothetical protein